MGHKNQSPPMDGDQGGQRMGWDTMMTYISNSALKIKSFSSWGACR